jgi:hypothetical protein
MQERAAMHHHLCICLLADCRLATRHTHSHTHPHTCAHMRTRTHTQMEAYEGSNGKAEDSD